MTTNIQVHSKESGFPIYKVENEHDCIKFSSKTKELKLEEVKNVKGAFSIHNVLTSEECKQFIEITEKMGYDIAPLSTMGGMVVDNDIRNNKRVIWQTEQNNKLLDTIYKRIKKFIPKEEKTNNGTWESVGLNERLRFYRYKGDEIFNMHYDGCFPRSSNEKSMFTFIIYLSDDFDNGETTFYTHQGKTVEKVKPVEGSCLLFYHGSHTLSPLHEGSKCFKGTKYVLRSDVMFKKK